MHRSWIRWLASFALACVIASPGLAQAGPATSASQVPAATKLDAASADALAQARARHQQARTTVISTAERANEMALKKATQRRLDRFAAASKAYRAVASEGEPASRVASACGQGLVLEDLAEFLRTEPRPAGLNGGAERGGYDAIMRRQEAQMLRSARAYYVAARERAQDPRWTQWLHERMARVDARLMQIEPKRR